MSTPELAFNSGDEVIRSISLQNPDGSLVDASDCTLTAEIWWRGVKRFELDADDGLPILDLTPQVGHSHALFHLDEEKTVEPPQGKVSYAKLVLVDSLGVTFSTGPLYLKKVLP